ncbi:MAG: HAD-IC family P-type ATPase [Methylohalobius sp. ZOD2]
MTQSPTAAHRTPVQILHDRLPGRLRIHVLELYRCPALQSWLETKLNQIPEIHQARASALTGNLVVEFDPAQATDAILKTLQDLLAEPEAQRALDAILKPATPTQSTRFRPIFGRHRRKDSRTATPPHARWHTMTAQETLQMLNASAQGLTDGVASERLAHYGPNVLAETKRRSSLEIVFEQLYTPPVILLGISAVISVATGGFLDAVVILTVVGINTTIGYVTESSAEAIIQGLGSMTPLHAEVIRAGNKRQIPVSEVVIGDILKLTPGTYIAADARLLSSTGLSVDESALTGESLPVKKNARKMSEPITPLAERRNQIFRGTVVTGGSGTAVVVAAGRYTEIGLIQALVGETETLQTPMQRQLERMGMQLALLSGGICVLMFMVGVLRGYGWITMLKSAISLAVAAVPEGLPTVATTTLALGIRRMRTRRALVCQLNAVENLGALQVICFDKTGTLTLNQMAVTRLQTSDLSITVEGGELLAEGKVLLPDTAPDIRKLLEIVILCSHVKVNENGLDGSPTEKALVECARNCGIDIESLRQRHPRQKTIHRAENRPYMITYHRGDDKTLLAAVKGSPQTVIEMCSHTLRNGQLEPLNETDRQHILAANDAMAGKALRVLGAAYGQCAKPREQPTGLIWLGLTGMADPIRPGIAQLIRRFHRAGIETVMITGDQSATAISVARQLELNGAKPLQVIDSTHLDKLEPELLRNLVPDVTVFARVSPAHKLRIVRALRDSGKVVSMIGDGINDAPALKAADVGIAMGRRGTDVARSVSDVVLEDDNLETLYTAIEQGRTIYADTRKSLHFLLATNLSEIEVMLSGVSLGAGEILTPMQLLWINLMTDIFPGLALSLEPPEEDVMALPPRKPDTPVITRRHMKKLGWESLSITGGAMGVYGYSLLRYGVGPRTKACVFQTLTLAQLLHTLSCRSEKHTLFHPGQKKNPYLVGALGISMGLQAAAVALPPLRKLLGLPLPNWADLLAIGVGASAPLAINETIKALTVTTEESE